MSSIKIVNHSDNQDDNLMSFGPVFSCILNKYLLGLAVWPRVPDLALYERRASQLTCCFPPHLSLI